MPRLNLATMYYGRCLLRRGTPRPYTRPVTGRRLTKGGTSLHLRIFAVFAIVHQSFSTINSFFPITNPFKKSSKI
ncbi:MAG: hypothetical protein HDS84_05015 [Bacteroidales bacterium]|nr:hypothetical protein [Bacteroidales bacterium]